MLKPMTDQMTAEMLRRWARQCATAATDLRLAGDERNRLLKMHVSLLELATQQDWLEGVPSRPAL
jgi:hypothetical protein